MNSKQQGVKNQPSTQTASGCLLLTVCCLLPEIEAPRVFNRYCEKQRGTEMRSYLSIAILMIIAALTYGCADPSANKQKATVANAQQESNTPKSSGTETLTISPENSKVEFVASKVTRSHNGSFKQFSGQIDLDPNNTPASQSDRRTA